MFRHHTATVPVLAASATPRSTPACKVSFEPAPACRDDVGSGAPCWRSARGHPRWPPADPCVCDTLPWPGMYSGTRSGVHPDTRMTQSPSGPADQQDLLQTETLTQLLDLLRHRLRVVHQRLQASAKSNHRNRGHKSAVHGPSEQAHQRNPLWFSIQRPTRARPRPGRLECSANVLPHGYRA